MIRENAIGTEGGVAAPVAPATARDNALWRPQHNSRDGAKTGAFTDIKAMARYLH